MAPGTALCGRSTACEHRHQGRGLGARLGRLVGGHGAGPEGGSDRQLQPALPGHLEGADEHGGVQFLVSRVVVAQQGDQAAVVTAPGGFAAGDDATRVRKGAAHRGRREQGAGERVPGRQRGGGADSALGVQYAGQRSQTRSFQAYVPLADPAQHGQFRVDHGPQFFGLLAVAQEGHQVGGARPATGWKAERAAHRAHHDPAVPECDVTLR